MFHQWVETTASNDRVTRSDPPFTVTNMRTVVLDSEGRLVEFHAVPPQLDDAPGTAPAPDWEPLPDEPLGLTVRLLAFVFVIAAAALIPAPGTREPVQVSP